MTGERGAALHRNLFHHASHSPHSRDEFQSEFSALDAGGSTLVLRADRFLQHHFWPGRSHWRLDEMGSGVARRHAPDDRATFPGILFRQHRKHSRACPHRKARLAARFAHRQPVCGVDQTIWLRQHDQRRARWRCRLRIALPARPRPKSAVDLALSDRPRVRRRRALLDHALPRGREFLDPPGPRAGLRLLQFSQHRTLSGRNFSAGLSIHFRLDRSSRDHCEYSSAAAHQTARTTGLADAAPRDCLHNYLLAIARFLAFCPAPVLQRQLLKSTANARNLVKSLRKISACAFGEMFLIKPPFLAPETAGAPLNYGQIKEKESSRKTARRTQSKGDSQGRRQKIDIEKSRANYKKIAKTSGEASAKVFQIQK